MSKDEIVAPILNAINDLKIDIREKRREIQKNREAIQKNAEEIRQNREAIQKNAEEIRQNREAIQKNTEEIRQNRQAIQRNSKEIQENKVAILSLTERFERFEMKYDKDYKEIYRIIDTFQRSTENMYEKHEVRIKKLECQY